MSIWERKDRVDMELGDCIQWSCIPVYNELWQFFRLIHVVMRGVSFRSYPQGCDSVSTFVHLFYIQSTGYSRNATFHPILHNNPKRPLPSKLRPLRPSPRLSLPLLRPRHAFDLITVNGLVRPLALDLSTYECTPPVYFLEYLYPIKVNI